MNDNANAKVFLKQREWAHTGYIAYIHIYWIYNIVVNAYIEQMLSAQYSVQKLSTCCLTCHINDR